jgi:hypothetical protein
MEGAHTVVKMVSLRARNGFNHVSWMPQHDAMELGVASEQNDLQD